MTCRRDIVIAVAIYGIAMAIGIFWILNGTLSDDGKALYATYTAYREMLQGGGFHIINTGLVSSCLTTTLFPAVVQTTLRSDPLLTYCTIPHIVYSLTPAFVYLISRRYRRYLNIWHSIVAVVLVLVCFNTMYAGISDKMGWAIGAMSVATWALLERRIVVAGIFATLVILSHYAVAFILLPMVAVVVVAVFVYRQRLYRRVAIVTLVVMVVVAPVWYFGVQAVAGMGLLNFARNMVGLESVAYTEDSGYRKMVIDLDTGNRQLFGLSPVQEVSKGENIVVLNTKRQADNSWDNFFRLDNREPIVQLAFGAALPYMKPYHIVGFAIYWWLMLWLAAGVLYGLVSRRLGAIYNGLAISACLLVALTVVIPYMSMGFGIVRSFTISLVVLAPCFVIGLCSIAQRLRIKSWYLIGLALLPYVVYLVW